MQRRSFLILASATLAILVLAIVAAATGNRGVTRPAANSKALPQLAARLGDLTWIRLARGGTSANFARVGSDWLVVEKGNYPAAADNVHQMLLALADLTLVEAKTRRPELLPRLGLDDPANGRSTLVAVQDTSGEVVVSLIVGKTRRDALGGGNDGVYVRRPGEDQAWLARGTLDLSGDVVSWLDRRIVDIPDARVAKVALTDPAGASVVLSRAAPEADFAVENPPADAKFKSAAVLREPASALDSLILDDVRPAPEMQVPDNGLATASFTTFEGLVVNLRLFERDKVNWLALDTAASGPAEAESKDINARVMHWTYAIPLYKANMLRTRLADLIEPPAKGS
jgi:hypothetical protein